MSRGLTSLWRLLAASPGPACYAIIDHILILSHLAWTQEWKKQEGWFSIDFSLDHPWLPLAQGVNPQNNSKSERGTLVESVLDSYFIYCLCSLCFHVCWKNSWVGWEFLPILGCSKANSGILASSAAATEQHKTLCTKSWDIFLNREPDIKGISVTIYYVITCNLQWLQTWFASKRWCFNGWIPTNANNVFFLAKK